MFKKFAPKDLILIALVSALCFVIAMTLGTWLVAATGTPMMGGLIINLFLAYILALTALILRKFGAITLFTLIYSLMSVPTINFGPPGFHKVIIGVSLGIVIDIILAAGKYKKWIYYFGAGFAFFVVGPYTLWIFKLFGLPAAEKLAPLLLPIMFIYLVEALIGTWLAMFTYEKKLKKSRLVRVFKS